MSKFSKMADKVAKLLRQAEDVVGTPEEAVFQAKAFELMAKYGLEMADIDSAKGGLNVSDPVDAIRLDIDLKGKYIAQQVLLLYAIARALHCRGVLIKGGKTLSLFGVPRHIDRVQMLWSILGPQMLRLVETVRPDQALVGRQVYDWRTGEYRQKGTAGQLRSYRRAWIAGFSQVVGERVTEQETKAVESAGGGALVLYKTDVERAVLALREAFPSTSRGRGSSRYNTSGYAHGQRDGRSASMAHSLAG